jgi:hypothetical protein
MAARGRALAAWRALRQPMRGVNARACSPTLARGARTPAPVPGTHQKGLVDVRLGTLLPIALLELVLIIKEGAEGGSGVQGALLRLHSERRPQSGSGGR